ncbi:MAG: RdgB/HAM1 family non-canonical purine NTP pyrophosphatase [Chlorobiaceae bacterium]
MADTTDTIITIVLATANPDKVSELRPMLESISGAFRVATLRELDAEIEVEETEPTLEGNALIKARAIYSHLSERLPFMIALSDDTGLEVDALGGAPGVYSARFAPAPEGKSPTYEENVNHLLQQMEGKKERSARFRTVIALKGSIPTPDGKTFSFEEIAEGVVEGFITGEKKGCGGFGYDPLFLVAAAAKTYAEMNIAEKNRLSHRSLAVRKSIERLHEILKENQIPLTDTP